MNARGMTLVETVVWVSVLTIVFAALVEAALYFDRTGKFALEQASAVSSAQRGIDHMVRTIREAAYSSEGAFPIVSIGANDLVFYADIDQDPLIEKVHYFLQGSSLMQGVVDASGDPPGYTSAEASSPLSDYVRNASQGITTFRYFDGAGAEITDYARFADVRFVEVNAAVNVDPNKLPGLITLRSSAALRNLTGK